MSKRSDGGFTLVEVAAAVLILAVLVVPLIAARNRVVASRLSFGADLAAVRLAASKMNELWLYSLDEVPLSGAFEGYDGYEWEFSMEPYEGLPSGDEGGGEEGVSRLKITRVELVVSYPSAVGREGRSLKIQTLLLEKEERRQ